MRKATKNTLGTVKDIIIIILIVAVVTLTVMYLLRFNSNTKTKQLVKDTLTAQTNISEYLGKLKSETFEVYTNEQLLVGSSDIQNTDTTRIKNNDNEEILQLVSIENKVNSNNSIFYKLNTDSFKKKFNIDLHEDDGITWYIQNTGEIKVNFINKPSWWTEELNAIRLGD